jgi:hypothetical protein
LTVAREEQVTAAEGFFSQYANLLTEDARYHWDKIVASQCDTAPWIDLQGKEHTRARKKGHKSFDDCVNFHLLTVFRTDAAERQKVYISNTLKKPQRVPVRYFFQRVEQLNGYLRHLPCLYNSPHASPVTSSVMPFDDAELATLLLRMCPDTWQNSYELTQDTVPQSLRKLLSVLENIEKCENSAGGPSLAPLPTANGKYKPNGRFDKSGKRVRPNSDADRIPKKARSEKYCALCKKYGGAHTTHDTGSCSKFEKDGKEKAGWGSKPPASAQGKYKKNDSYKSSFAALEKRCNKLEKRLKKGKSSHKKKRYASSSSDSDSE